MAVRTTQEEVRSVLGIASDSDIAMYPFINTATNIVSRISTNATASSITISSSELQKIEAYLAAHFYALAYPQSVENQAGKSRAKYMGKTDMGFDYTSWGQMAKAMDVTGTLSGMDDGVLVGGHWLGTDTTVND